MTLSTNQFQLEQAKHARTQQTHHHKKFRIDIHAYRPLSTRPSYHSQLYYQTLSRVGFLLVVNFDPYIHSMRHLLPVVGDKSGG